MQILSRGTKERAASYYSVAFHLCSQTSASSTYCSVFVVRSFIVQHLLAHLHPSHHTSRHRPLRPDLFLTLRLFVNSPRSSVSLESPCVECVASLVSLLGDSSGGGLTFSSSKSSLSVTTGLIIQPWWLRFNWSNKI